MNPDTIKHMLDEKCSWNHSKLLLIGVLTARLKKNCGFISLIWMKFYLIYIFI